MTYLKFQVMTKIVLLTDDTSIIITNSNPTHFKDSVIKIFQGIKTWFSTNLSLNIDKTHFMQFVTKNSSLIDLYITDQKKANIFNAKCLGIIQDNTLTWKTHIDMFIPKLSSACIAIRAVRLICPKNH